MAAKVFWADVFKRDGGVCQQCGTAEFSTLTLDHLLPRSQGGCDCAENLQLLCEPCNAKKGNSMNDADRGHRWTNCPTRAKLYAEEPG